MEVELKTVLGPEKIAMMQKPTLNRFEIGQPLESQQPITGNLLIKPQSRASKLGRKHFGDFQNLQPCLSNLRALRSFALGVANPAHDSRQLIGGTVTTGLS